MKPLTAKQRQVLDLIESAVRDSGSPPTVREIGEAIGATSTTAPRRHLAALERKGYIERRPDVARGIALTHPLSDEDYIPLVGRVAAGSPILAEENVEERLAVGSVFGGGNGVRFALRVQGDSMIDAQICDGDFVVVQQQPRVENGQIGVAIVDGEATVKRIHQDGPVLRLVPENEFMQPMEFDLRHEPVTIAGKVIGVVRRM